MQTIPAIANRQGLDLPVFLRERFEVYRVHAMVLVDASWLIDGFKAAPTNATG